MEGKKLRQIIYDYVKQAPGQQVKSLSKRNSDGTDGPWLIYLKMEGHITPFTSPEDFTSFFNSANSNAKILVDTGVLEHLKGIRGYRMRGGLSDPAAKLLMMGASERWQLIKTEWKNTPQGRNAIEAIAAFDRLHSKSPVFNRDAQYPEGTADGTLGPSAKPWIANGSHAIDRCITSALGLPSWDRSANMMLEHIAVNMGRYRGYITTEVVPGALVYRMDPSVNLGKGLEFRDGQLHKVPNLSDLRAAFLLRKLLMTMLESNALLKEVAETLQKKESEVAESEV